MTTMRDTGEFGFIERIARMAPASPQVVEGIGDDCAVVRAGDRLLLVSCDLSLEDVHFRLRHGAPEDIGYKAAASSLSDIAAMGGIPLFCLVSLACPLDADVALVEDIYRGLVDAVSQSGAAIIGGDTTRSPGGFILDVTVIGEPIGGRYLTRRGAQPGDYLAVTGQLGLSAAGLHALEHGHDAPELVRAHCRPVPRLSEGQWFAACPNIAAMIDISDGLVQDAGHLVEQTHLGVEIHPDAIPVAPALRAYCEHYRLDPLEFCLAGGEDYELAFAIHGAGCRTMHDAFRREFHTTGLHCVGVFTDAWRGVRVAGRAPGRAGFDHFRDGPVAG